MSAFTRDEIDVAFQHYQAVTRRAGETMDWSPWADLFSEDADYWEHLYGRMTGREEIRTWIVNTMTTYPGNEMPWFPPQWVVIDEEKGWVVWYVRNIMRDPGDGSVHEAYNVSIAHYAGANLWSYEEDVYNVDDFVKMIAGWEAAVREQGGEPGGSVEAISAG